MKNWGEGSDQGDKWKLFWMCLTNVSLKTWVLWEGNTHGMGTGGGNTIWERLDRAVTTTNWIDTFPATKVVHLECRSSDHKPLIIQLKGIQIKQQKRWRFERMWLEGARCSEVVDLAWRRNFPGNLLVQVEGKIKECQVKLKQWS